MFRGGVYSCWPKRPIRSACPQNSTWGLFAGFLPDAMLLRNRNTATPRTDPTMAPMPRRFWIEDWRSTDNRNRALGIAQTLSTFALFLLLIGTVQRSAGAFTAMFGGFPDEPAHFMGGLLVHDYLVYGLGTNPFAFARNYYLHLPYFALGVWPPFFYLLEAVWMLIFGIERASVLWLVATSGAALGTLLFTTLKKEVGSWTATTAAAVFLLVPAVQWSSCVLMVDLTCSLFALAAIIFFAHFYERQRWQDAMLMGLFCGLSLLTKNSTYFILLVPPIVIAVTGRWNLLRRWTFWMAAAIAVCVYLPWLYVSRSVLLLGIQGLVLPGFLGIQRAYAVLLWKQMSFLLPLALAGAICVLRSKHRRGNVLPWCMLAIFPATSVGIFVARVPVQDRLLILSYAAVVFLVAEFCTAVAGTSKGAILMLACLTAFAATKWMQFRALPPNNVRSAVAFLESRDGRHPGAILVPSRVEGPWIAEFAQNDPVRPMRVVVRPTKFFGEEDWNGTNWRTYFNSPDEINSVMGMLPVKYCILAQSTTGRRYPHDEMLESMIGGEPEIWKLIFKIDGGTGYRIYENSRWTPAAEPVLHQQLGRALGRVLKALQ
jgi:Dolichyl-phosphate-mannose-protein mannosyltransferase